MTISANYPTVRPTLNLDFAKTKALDPRITFTRSTTATYYDGVTSALAEQNLILQSQSFNTTPWATVATVTVGSSAVVSPDGSSTMNLITYTSTTGQQVFYQLINMNIVAGTQYTLSIYLQSGSATQVYIGINGRTASANNISSSLLTLTSTTTRFTATFTAAASDTGLYVEIGGGIPSNGTLLLPATGTIYAWGAQLEQRSSVTAYNATTTTAITNYIPVLQTAAANIPRFDCNPTTGESLGLLIEQQSTNICTYSNTFTQAIWSKNNVSVTTTADIAPDGTQTASKIVEDTANASHNIYNLVFISSAVTTYTFSVYLKAGEVTSVDVDMSDSLTGDAFVIANLSNGTLGSVTTSGSWSSGSATITAVGNNWYRVSVTATKGSASTNLLARIILGGNVTYTGNGYNGVYMWGAQVEATAFSTSFIPTTSAAVTRTIDYAIMTGSNFSSWYNLGQGTFYSEFNGGTASLPDPVGLIPYGSALMAPYSGGVISDMYGNAFGAGPGGTGIGVNAKAAHSYNYNSLTNILGFNGSANTQASCALRTPTGINIGGRGAGDSLDGHIKKVVYYPISLTASQIASLTGS